MKGDETVHLKRLGLKGFKSCLLYTSGLVNEIRMSTRPDCISDSILERLKKYDASIIELGVQSMDAKVLIDSVRGHDIESVIKSAKLIKKHDIKLGLQMMVGLPSDTEEKCIETARKFISLQPDCVRIYPTLVEMCIRDST